MLAVDTAVLGALVIDISTVIIVAVVAFVIGALLAFLLVTPARSASNHLARESRSRVKQLENQVHELQDRNAQLQEQNASVAAERSHLRGQLDALRQHNVAAASAPNRDDYGTEPPAEQPAQNVRPEPQPQPQPESQLQAQTPPQHESFGERIKDFFSSNNPDNPPSQTPNAAS